MNMIQRIEHWGDTHHPRWVDVLRVALGVLIFAKGVSFIMDRESVGALIERTNFQLSIWSAVHYVVFAHLVGEFLSLLVSLLGWPHCCNCPS